MVEQPNFAARRFIVDREVRLGCNAASFESLLYSSVSPGQWAEGGSDSLQSAEQLELPGQLSAIPGDWSLGTKVPPRLS